MAGINQRDCPHTQFTGYTDHCVCISCGWTIEYESIRLEDNDASLKNYIKKTLKQVDAKQLSTGVSFDVGVSPQGVVNDASPHRIKFTIHKKL